MLVPASAVAGPVFVTERSVTPMTDVFADALLLFELGSAVSPEIVAVFVRPCRRRRWR